MTSSINIVAAWYSIVASSLLVCYTSLGRQVRPAQMKCAGAGPGPIQNWRERVLFTYQSAFFVLAPSCILS